MISSFNFAATPWSFMFATYVPVRRKLILVFIYLKKFVLKTRLFELYRNNDFWNCEPVPRGAEDLLKKKKVVKCPVLHSDRESVCDIPEGVILCYNFVNLSPVSSWVCVCLRSHEKEINSDALITWNRMPPSEETDLHVAAGSREQSCSLWQQ